MAGVKRFWHGWKHHFRHRDGVWQWGMRFVSQPSLFVVISSHIELADAFASAKTDHQWTEGISR